MNFDVIIKKYELKNDRIQNILHLVVILLWIVFCAEVVIWVLYRDGMCPSGEIDGTR